MQYLLSMIVMLPCKFKASFSKQGGLVAVLESMRDNPDFVDVQEIGGLCLAKLCDRNLESMKELVSIGGLGIVAKTMAGNVQSATIQESMICVFSHLADASIYTDVLFAIEPMKLTLSAMGEHMDVATLQWRGAVLLGELAKLRQESTTSFVPEGCAGIVLAALSRHAGNSEVAAPILSGMSHLVRIKDFNAELSEKQGLRAVQELAHMHAYDRVLQQQVKRVVGALTAMKKATARQSAQDAENDDNSCIVCMERPACWVYESCGHRCVCKACKQKLKKGGKKQKNDTLTTCLLCRTESRIVPSATYAGEVLYEP